MKVKLLVDPLPTEENNEESMMAAATARAEALGAQPGGATVQVPTTPTVEPSEIS